MNTVPITPGFDLPSLQRLVRRLRAIAYLVAVTAMIVAAPAADDHHLAAGAVLLGAIGLVTGRGSGSLRAALLCDLIAAVGLWWLFGPISGADFIPVYVVAVGAFLLTRPEAKGMLAMALATKPLEVGLHFLAERYGLPLFHPPSLVPSSEFLIGSALQLLILGSLGILFVRMALALRAGQAALAADLQRQVELHALKDRFVATVSHELRTPLTSLKGFTRTMLDGEVTGDERREFLSIMWHQADELHALIEDLIAFSLVGAGRLTVVPESIDLGSTVHRVLQGLAHRSPQVSVEIPAGLTVKADPLRLRQILRNLIDNGLKYGFPPIRISGRATTDGRVAIRVSDRGPGIPPERLDEIFEPYARLVDDRDDVPARDRTGPSPGLPAG